MAVQTKRFRLFEQGASFSFSFCHGWLLSVSFFNHGWFPCPGPPPAPGHFSPFLGFGSTLKIGAMRMCCHKSWSELWIGPQEFPIGASPVPSLRPAGYHDFPFFPCFFFLLLRGESMSKQPTTKSVRFFLFLTDYSDRWAAGN